MREHVQTASRRRDQRLAATRKITLWISAGAAAATLGFGTAFAHAVPGHAASSTNTPRATTSAPASSGSAPASSGSAPASSAPASPSASKPAQLSQPQQQPQQPTHTAAPTVTSGGS